MTEVVIIGSRRFWGVALAMALAAGAVAAPADYEGKRIVALEFEPREQPLPDDALQRALPFAVGGSLRLEDTRTAIERLYATGRYETVSIDASPAADGVRLRILTTPRFFIGQVQVEGVPEPPNTGQLVNATKLNLGEELSDENVARAVENLQRVLRDNGFFEATIRPFVVREALTEEADIRFEVTSGPRARFTTPDVRGDPQRSLQDIIRRTNWQRLWGLLGWRSVTANRVQQGLERVRRSYLKRNHLMARVNLGAMEYDPSRSFVKPILNIEAGPRIRVRTEGVRLSQGRLRQLIPIFQEQTVDRDLLMEGGRNLEQVFQSEGFFDASAAFQQVNSGPEETILYTIDRGRRYKLVHLEVTGNQYFDAPTIRERMLVTPATFLRYRRGRYSQELLERDRDAIADLYRTNGFRDVEVTSRVEMDYQGKEREIAVFIEIKEGPQWFVDSLDVSGIDLRLLPEIEALLQSTAGQPYSAFNVATDRDNVLNYYFNNGYPEARFDSTATPGPRPNTVKLRYVVEEGRRNYVRQILISGLRETNRKLIDSRLLLEPEMPLSQSQMVESQRRLYDLGIFAKVDMAVQNPEGRERNKYVLYQFEEASRYSLNLGFGAEIARIGGDPGSLSAPAGGAGFSPRVSVGLTRNNMFGIGHTAGVLSRFSNIQRRVLLNYLAPQFGGRDDVSLTFNGLWDDSRNIRTFTSRRWEGSATIGQRLSRANSFQYRLGYRRVTVDENTLNIRPDLIPVFAQPSRVGFVGASFIQDRRDDPVDSRRGIYSTLDLTLATRWLASQTEYFRFVLRNATYHRIGRDLVFARLINTGWLYNFGLNPIPLPERFFAGGATAHRGFPENQAGPRDPTTGFPIGGNAFLVNSLELRFPLIGQNIGGVLFHDAGNVYSSANNLSLRVRQRNLLDFDYTVHAVGFGLRYRTPIGPVRVDLAYAPNSPRFVGFEGTREELLLGGGRPNVLQRISRFQFHFSLGQTF
ncbi:MAG: BamA/TamA family outer membrane protein [Bryobacteraceae bacterium]|nr:BamA/TamA family outer membrane protein [Bryobacteraceae bacterium]